CRSDPVRRAAPMTAAGRRSVRGSVAMEFWPGLVIERHEMAILAYTERPLNGVTLKPAKLIFFLKPVAVRRSRFKRWNASPRLGRARRQGVRSARVDISLSEG